MTDTELQSTVARVLSSDPPSGGIGDLHADVAVLKSRLREAVEALKPFAEAAKKYRKTPENWNGQCGVHFALKDIRRAAAFIVELERKAGT